MKKLKRVLSGALAILFVSTSCFANKSVVIDKRPRVETSINAVLLDADPTSITSSAVNVEGNNRIGIFWTYDETQVGGVSAALTVDVSFDGTTWQSAGFFDVAGGATFQTTETLTADGNYIAWFSKDMNFPFVRTIVTCTGCDVDDTVLTTVKLTLDR